MKIYGFEASNINNYRKEGVSFVKNVFKNQNISKVTLDSAEFMGKNTKTVELLDGTSFMNFGNDILDIKYADGTEKQLIKLSKESKEKLQGANGVHGNWLNTDEGWDIEI